MFFLPLGRFWELLCGGIVSYIMFEKQSSVRKFKRNIGKLFQNIEIINKYASFKSHIPNFISLIGIMLLVYSIYFIDDKFEFSSNLLILPIIGTILIIISGSQALLNRVLFMNPIAVWFGLISYPLYLWHWPILSFIQIIDSEALNLSLRIFVIFLSIVLAFLIAPQ